MMTTSFKQERHDEAEIQELAAKMIEAKKVKIQAHVRRSRNKNEGEILVAPINVPDAKSMGDEESLRGRFGWVVFGENPIPYITRTGEKYCAVRMVEMKVLNKYLNFLHQVIYNCTCIRSYYITKAERRLLNEINFEHCDYHFGQHPFTSCDLIVRLADAIEFYHYLDACYTKLMNGSTNPLDKCGFIRINKEFVVPYTVHSSEKYVPLFCFEGEIDTLKLKTDTLEGWDLSYLKFCSVISLNDIKNNLPPGTLFEDYWPSKVVDSQLLINGKTQNQVGQWTRQPAGTLVAHGLPPASPKPATQDKSGY
ncbi:hypothetical protein FQA39_LY12196 [Lamprigera yunnana]|nr:hypothetical protein FQA39_LY12196 [Lamprigera yunnana]